MKIKLVTILTISLTLVSTATVYADFHYIGLYNLKWINTHDLNMSSYIFHDNNNP